MQLHVGLVISCYGQIVLGLHMSHKVVSMIDSVRYMTKMSQGLPDEEQSLVADGTLVVTLLGDLRFSPLLHIVLHA